MPAEEQREDEHPDEALGALEDDVHPVARYFADRLTELRERNQVYISTRNEYRPLTPYQVHKLLIEHRPDLSVSQAHVYRLCRGAIAPRIDVVYELAMVFRVSPKFFLPERDLDSPDVDAEQELL